MSFTLSFVQAFNWLLCNVIQTTSLHDILWHFVASLTPAPVEPEEEEDEENKTNKENAEQVSETLGFLFVHIFIEESNSLQVIP